jgi:hypothetical protein
MMLHHLAIPILAVVSLGSISFNSSQERVFTPGELVEVGGGQTYKVYECRPERIARHIECEIQQWENGGPTGQRIWMPARDIAAGEARVRQSRGLPPITGTGAAAGAVTDRGTGGRAVTAGASGGRAASSASPPVSGATSQAASQCPRTPYGGPVPGSRPASPAVFRQKIADAVTMAAYGPYWYGVRFDAFQVGAPIRNSVGVRAGQGANRVTNGAPPGATLYPVTTTVSVCEGAPTASSGWRTRQSKYYCFVSANNEWTCGATN